METNAKYSMMMTDSPPHSPFSTLSLEPIRIIMEELQSDDSEIRTESVKKLSIIAKAMGTLRSKDELLPFLHEFIQTEEEDEVLLALAEQFSNISDWVDESFKESFEFHQYIISIGEIILSSEEVIVREQACRSFDHLMKGSPERFSESFFSLAKKLNSTDSFIKKASSLSICSSILKHFCSSDSDGSMLSLSHRAFEILYDHENLSDDSCLPIIKRSVFSEIDGILKFLVEHNDKSSSSMKSLLLEGFDGKNFLNIITSAVNEYHEYIQILSIGPLSSLMSLVQQDGDGDSYGSNTLDNKNAEIICNAFIELLSNRSWKVVTIICPHLPSFFKTYPSIARKTGNSLFNKEIDVIELFLLAFSENDTTIINAATNVLAPIIQSIMLDINFFEGIANDKFIIPESCFYDPLTMNASSNLDVTKEFSKILALPVQRIYQYIQLMANNPLEEMRSSIVGNLPILAKNLGYECSSVLILPLIASLVQDPKPKVRLTLIRKLELFVEFLGSKGDLMMFINPAIESLSSDLDWRVRKSAIEFFPQLAITVGNDFFSFEQNNRITLLFNALCDDIWAVREMAILSSCELLKIASKNAVNGGGKEWICAFFERCKGIASSPNYLKRQVVPMLLGKSVEGIIDGDMDLCDYLNDYYSPLLSLMIDDKNPNVRMNVAKAIGSLIKFISFLLESSSIIESFRVVCLNNLGKIVGDPDMDVKMEVEKAMKLAH